MFRSIASAVARALKSINATLFDCWHFMLRTASEVALFPFAAIASFNGLHRRPSAAHASDADAGVRRGGLRRAISPEPGARTQADRDAVSTAQGYCRAHPAARDHYDLSALSRDVQDALLDLGDLEVAALAQADVRAIRAFIAGENHGILGVPRVRQIEDRRRPGAIRDVAGRTGGQSQAGAHVAGAGACPRDNGVVTFSLE